MRGEQLARQWRILQLLETSKRGLSIAELAQMEGVAWRTVQRDLDALQEAGFPLLNQRVDRANRWAFVDTFHFRLPPPFTLTELMSLHLYRDLTRVFKGTAYYEALESLFRKVKSALPARTLTYLDHLQSSFAVGIRPYREYGRFREILNQVDQAVATRCRLEMAYHGLRGARETVRKIDPYKIWFFDGTIYLIGYCHLRGQVRMFVVDRIKMLRLTEERFILPAAFSLDDFLKHSFKVMHDELFRVRLKVSPGWSRWVGEKTWHDSQKSVRLPDGGLELTFQVAGLDEIRMWVLSLGPEAEVLEPERLREEVQNALRATLSLYQPRDFPAAPRLDSATPDQAQKKSTKKFLP